jgi:hypothetical protein
MNTSVTTAILPPYMDSTMMSCYRSCPRKFYNEFVLGLRPSIHSIDLHAGAVFSAALESFRLAFWGQGLDVPTSTARAYARFVHDWNGYTPHKETAKTEQNMWAAVESYIAQYPPRTDTVQPYMLDKRPTVEFSFAIPLEPATEFNCGRSDKFFPVHPVTKDPWIYCGRSDLLGEYTKKIAIVDEKTAGRLESNWSDKWNLRSQFMGYCWALQQSGVDCDTAIVRGIIITSPKKGVEIRHVEAIKQYPRFLIERWHDQLRRDLWRLTRNWQEGYFDYNLNETCTQYNHCQFMDLCTSAKPEQWYSTYEVKRWNPLAKNPSGGASLPSISPAARPASLGTPLPVTLS